jgi:hypothetical protein
LFDSADIYSGGAAEEILGEAIKGRRNQVLISMKATFRLGEGPNDVGSSRFHLIEACEASLRRLRIDVCVGGACASPPEDCGGPEAYMEKMDHHRWNPPLDELQLIADAVGRVIDSQGHERIRDLLADVDALEEAVDRLETYKRFGPDRFDRRKLNRRLKRYVQGDEEWLWE